MSSGMDNSGFRTFETAWNHFHSGHVPVSHVMRHAKLPHWQRFHSLPASKQYPDTHEEMRTVIARANTMAYATLRREDAWLVTYSFEDDHFIEPPLEADIRRWLKKSRATKKIRLQRYNMHSTGMVFHDDEDDGSWVIHAASVRWGDRRFTQLLKEIALDAAQSSWLWMSNRTGAIFAPYDGGADLFLPTAGEVDQLRARWRDWLPAFPSG